MVRSHRSITHPFVVFQRSSEAHCLDELCEGADFFLAEARSSVLRRLPHTAELTDDTREKQSDKGEVKVQAKRQNKGENERHTRQGQKVF